MLGQVCDDPRVTLQGEPLTKILQQLQALNLSEHVWHLALQKGARLLLPMREFYSGSAITSVADYLRILERLRITAKDTPTALRLLFSEFGHENARKATYWPKLQPHQAAFAHLLRALREASPAQPPAEEQIAMVVRWVVSNKIHGWDRAQRQGG